MYSVNTDQCAREVAESQGLKKREMWQSESGIKLDSDGGRRTVMCLNSETTRGYESGHWSKT